MIQKTIKYLKTYKESEAKNILIELANYIIERKS